MLLWLEQRWSEGFRCCGDWNKDEAKVLDAVVIGNKDEAKDLDAVVIGTKMKPRF